MPKIPVPSLTKGKDRSSTTPGSIRESANAAALALNPHHDTNLDPTRVAMLIETRNLTYLPALLSSFIGVLPPQWVFRMIGTDEAFENIKRSLPLMRAVKTGKLVLTNLPDEYPVAGQEEISATLTNLTFYRDFLAPAEWLLILQADTALCSASDQSLDDWVDMGYPWVGAPWYPDVPGGNGGLSLRYVPRLISILEKESRIPGHEYWEDRWLCDRIPDTALPPLTKYFSVESVWYERPLGYHLRGSGKLLDAKIWGNKTRKRHIFEYCPETKLILGNMRVETKEEQEKEFEEVRWWKGNQTASGTEPLTAVEDVDPKDVKQKSTSEMIKEDWQTIVDMEASMAERQRLHDERMDKLRAEAAAAKAQGTEITDETSKAEIAKLVVPLDGFDPSRDRQKLKYTYALPAKVVDQNYLST